MEGSDAGPFKASQPGADEEDVGERNVTELQMDMYSTRHLSENFSLWREDPQAAPSGVANGGIAVDLTPTRPTIDATLRPTVADSGPQRLRNNRFVKTTLKLFPNSKFAKEYKKTSIPANVSRSPYMSSENVNKSSTSGAMTREMRRKRLYKEPFRFLDLPVEVRANAYGYVLGLAGGEVRPNYELDTSFVWEDNSIHVPKFRGLRPGALRLKRNSKSIFLVNKQISAEALDCLYSKIRFILEQDQAVAFRTFFCPMIGTINTSRIKIFQMDIPNCLKVKPGVFIPEYVDFITNSLPELSTLVLTTTFYAAYPAFRWMEEHRALLHTTASIILAHKTLETAIWTECGKPPDSATLIVPLDLGNRKVSLKTTLTQTQATGLQGVKSPVHGLILDCAAVCNAGWNLLKNQYDARMWAMNADVPDELFDGGGGVVDQEMTVVAELVGEAITPTAMMDANAAETALHGPFYL